MKTKNCNTSINHLIYTQTHVHTSTLPSFLVLHYWRQLLVISNQDKSLGVEQRSQTDRLADLWRLIYDAEIEAATRENGMFDAHTGGSHHQLERETEAINDVMFMRDS